MTTNFKQKWQILVTNTLFYKTILWVIAVLSIHVIAEPYLKVEKRMLPYGLRLEDDTAFIRQAAQINFDNGDSGAELGLEFNRGTVNFAATNGSTATTNDDEKFQHTLRNEYLGQYWRLGGSALVNDSESGKCSMYSVFGVFN